MFAVEGPNGAVSVEIKDHLKIGRDVKLVERQRNTSSTVVIPEPRIVFKEAPPAKPLNPAETILESERILDTVHHLKANPMTIGDLSGLKDRKRNEDSAWIQKSVNMDDVVTVGDLSVMERSGKGLDDLYQGQSSSNIRPSTSEAQKLDADRIRRPQQQVDEVLHIRNLLASGKDERLERYVERYIRSKPEKEPKEKTQTSATSPLSRDSTLSGTR